LARQGQYVLISIYGYRSILAISRAFLAVLVFVMSAGLPVLAGCGWLVACFLCCPIPRQAVETRGTEVKQMRKSVLQSSFILLVGSVKTERAIGFVENRYDLQEHDAPRPLRREAYTILPISGKISPCVLLRPDGILRHLTCNKNDGTMR
jgi:hypothetical protein